MAPSLGVNLRVTGHCHQGGRKYMEDVFSVAYQQTEDEKDLEYAFFGIFDGHGGREAALYAKNHLMDNITSNRNFWSEDDELVLKAIREGFLWTQQGMWKDLPNWKKTATGLPSTAGTTASVCFIKRGKLFIGHVGDSGIVLGERDPNHPSRWKTRLLTREHKPDCDIELARIKEAGGKVVAKAGVPRVVWYRPSNGHQGPVRRSTPIDEVPFLAVARALGDLWSYNAEEDVFIVSPDPDVHVYELNVLKDRCLVLATDGAWNVLSPDNVVQSVSESEMNNEKHMINPQGESKWVNPSKKLVDLALERWKICNLRADNTSIVTVMLDPPGPPRAQVLKRLYGVAPLDNGGQERARSPAQTEAKENDRDRPNIAIISRFPNSQHNHEQEGKDLITEPKSSSSSPRSLISNLTSDSDDNTASQATKVRIVHDSTKSEPQKMVVSPKTTASDPLPNPSHILRRGPSIPHVLLKDCNTSRKTLEYPSGIAISQISKVRQAAASLVEKLTPDDIQINEVSSTEDHERDRPPPLPEKVTRKPNPTVSTPTLRRELADLKLNASSFNAGMERCRTRNRSGNQGRRSIEMPASEESHDQNMPPRTKAPEGVKFSMTTPLRSSSSRPKPVNVTEISPRILRPRNTPAKSSSTPSAASSGVKRKRRSGPESSGGVGGTSLPSAAAPKVLRSASKQKLPLGRRIAGPGSTPAKTSFKK